MKMNDSFKVAYWKLASLMVMEVSRGETGVLKQLCHISQYYNEVR